MLWSSRRHLVSTRRSAANKRTRARTSRGSEQLHCSRMCASTCFSSRRIRSSFHHANTALRVSLRPRLRSHACRLRLFQADLLHHLVTMCANVRTRASATAAWSLRSTPPPPLAPLEGPHRFSNARTLLCSVLRAPRVNGTGCMLLATCGSFEARYFRRNQSRPSVTDNYCCEAVFDPPPISQQCSPASCSLACSAPTLAIFCSYQWPQRE